MRIEEACYGTDVMPAPPPGRALLGLLCLLALLPLWAGLLLPLMPERAVQGRHLARDPYAVVFEDGHRLVCEGCRSLSVLWRQWIAPAGSAPAAPKPAPLLLRPAAPPPKPLPKPSASAKPAAPSMPKLLPVTARRSARRHAGAAGFSDDVKQVLPHYRAAFEEAGRRNGLDWRLLAAVGYQESRWNPAAQSPTGVRGLMMLTTETALDLGVNRDDGAQSIRGAGRLLQSLYGQLPPRIREPDRTAMALAAYNQGLGHLLDARDVAVNLGRNPDRWADVRQALPLLGDPDWQATTKYGAARGDEAVAFVDSVRLYYARLQEIAVAGEAKVAAPVAAGLSSARPG